MWARKWRVYCRLAVWASLPTAAEKDAAVFACTTDSSSSFQSRIVLTKKELRYCSLPLFSGILKLLELLMTYLAIIFVVSYPENPFGVNLFLDAGAGVNQSINIASKSSLQGWGKWCTGGQ